MIDEFVTYEIALRMKALEFEQPCMGVYYGDEDDIQFSVDFRETQYYAQKGYKNGILAPTWKTAFEWFDSNTKYSGFIVPSKEEGLFSWWIKHISDPQMDNESAEDFLTREEAELDCLIKLIDLIEKDNE